MDQDIPLADMVNIELDRRKLNKLVEDGVLTPEDINHAPVIEVERMDSEIINISCGQCGYQCKKMEDIESHLVKKHIKSATMEPEEEA